MTRILALQLTNFRSARSVRLDLDPVTYLVGPNASGKSNLIDGLQFIRDALVEGLSLSLDRRGGIHRIRYRSGSRDGRPADLHFCARVRAPNRIQEYKFALRVTKGGQVLVPSETLAERTMGANGEESPWRYVFDTREGDGFGRYRGLPRRGRTSEDQLTLNLHREHHEVRPAWRALTEYRTYNLAPEHFKNPVEATPWKRLVREGSNLAWILARLERRKASTLPKILSFLQSIVPGVVQIGSDLVGDRRVITIEQEAGGMRRTLEGIQCSDGTLRCLGILTALFQDPRLSTIAIEEPESAIHPGALAALVDAFDEASPRTQVIVSTHSPELLDVQAVKVKNIRLVSWDGETRVQPVSQGVIALVRDHLSTPGRLLRSNALTALGEDDPD